MKSNLLVNMIFLMLSILITACGNNSKDEVDKVVTEQQKRQLNWAAIPSEFNPQVNEESFQTSNINKIYVDMFGFKDDVEVVYTDTLDQGHGYLKLYSVYKESGSSGSFSVSTSGQTLQLNRYGTYQCSIKIENGNISRLKGLCFVRLQIYLPTGSEIEIYNIKQLISKRFIPVDSEAFIKNFKDASFSDEKIAAIEDFISSYNGMNKAPQLTANQLGIVVSGFAYKQEMFVALRKLHVYVIDRKNLYAMIENKINYFDREEARKICGL